MKRDAFPSPLAGFPAGVSGFRSEPDASDESDGRRRRRLNNREAVVDALLDLYREGNLRPSTDEIAERAGLSPRSLFRYFEDVDDLAGAAVQRAQERALPLLVMDIPSDAPRARRIKALVDQRFRIFEELHYAQTVVRLRAPFQPLVATLLSQNRAFLREQMRELFSTELAGLTRPRAREALAALDVISSFETYDLLRFDHRMSTAQARSAMSNALETILDATTDKSD